VRDDFLAEAPVPSTRKTNDAEIVTAWVAWRKVPLVAVVPSLVEHENVVPSLHIRDRMERNPARRAALYIGERSALELFPPRIAA
jgi:hypothetical protein